MKYRRIVAFVFLSLLEVLQRQCGLLSSVVGSTCTGIFKFCWSLYFYSTKF